MAPLNVPSLLGEDASELYAKNQYNLLVLMMKDNVITIDWGDEVLAKTVLTMPVNSDWRGEPRQPTWRRQQGCSNQGNRESRVSRSRRSRWTSR